MERHSITNRVEIENHKVYLSHFQFQLCHLKSPEENLFHFRCHGIKKSKPLETDYLQNRTQGPQVEPIVRAIGCAPVIKKNGRKLATHNFLPLPSPPQWNSNYCQQMQSNLWGRSMATNLSTAMTSKWRLLQNKLILPKKTIRNLQSSFCVS